MRGYRLEVIGFLVMLLVGCQQTPEVGLTTRTCATMPSPRASACACVLDGQAYVFGGRNQKGTMLADLWRYSPATDSWTDLGKAPMNARVNATMSAYADKLYIGLGYSAARAYNDTAYQRDWWAYTPATNSWLRLADFPDKCTVAARSYTIGGSIYVLYGFDYGFTQTIYRYDIATDTWTKYPDNIERAHWCFGANGAMLNGLLYFGTGFDTHNLTQWFAVDIEKDQWKECTSIPGKGRQWCACAADKQYVYLFGGRYFAGDMTGNEIFDTYMRYAPDQNSWEWCGVMPCGRAENQIAFAIHDTVYFGLGENEEGNVLGALYRIED